MDHTAQATATKLERLVIGEVSGVDDPANQSPGWMVAKSTSGDLSLAVEMERVTKASDSKEPYGDVKYADPGLQKDGKKRYPLDTEQHIRAAWSYINQDDNASLYSADDLAKVKSAIKSAMKKIGADVAKSDDANSIVAKIRDLVLGKSTGKDDLDMDEAGLTKILDEREDALVSKVVEAVAKSVTPATNDGGTPTGTAATTTPEGEDKSLSAEDLTKVVTDAVTAATEKRDEDVNEILEKTLDRVERIETALGIAARKSLDGQESGDGEGKPAAQPTVKDAIGAALAGRVVKLR